MKKVLLLLFVCLLLIPGVFADLSDGIAFCNDLNEDGENYVDLIQGTNYTNQGTSRVVDPIDFGRFYNVTTDDHLTTPDSLTLTSEYTLGFVVRTNTVQNNKHLLDCRDSGNNWFLFSANSGDLDIGSSLVRFSGAIDALANNEFQWVVIRVNATDSTLFINGTVFGVDTDLPADAFTDCLIHLGSRFSNTLNWDGTIGQFVGWNLSLNNSEILAYYNSGSGQDCPTMIGGDPSVPATLTFVFPTDGSTISSWNGTVHLTSNQPINLSVNDSALVNISINTTNFIYNYTSTIAEGNYFFNFSGNNSNGNVSDILNFNLFINPNFNGWVVPELTHSTYGSNGSLFVSINFSDDNRNLTQIFVYNSTPSLVQTINITNTGSGFYLYNQTVINLTDSIYYINATHTDIFGNVIDSTTITASDFVLDNCSTASMRTINFTLRNESDDSILNGQMDFVFDYWKNDYLGNRIDKNYSTGVTGNFTSFCIFPNGTSFLSDIMVDYIFDTVHYNFFAFQLNMTNATRIVNLYVTPGTTQVIFNVKDFTDTDVEDAYITIEKYNVATNSYTTTEILKTDTSGNAIGNIVLNIVWYRFTVTFLGVTRLVDGPTKVLTAIKNFRIDLAGSDAYEDWHTTQGISHDLSFTNSTLNFRLEYSDPSLTASEICLRAEKRNVSGITLINQTCVTSSSGVILSNIGTGVSGNVYLGTAWAVVDGNKFVLDSLEISFAEDYKIYDNDGQGNGIFVAFFFTLALMFIGIMTKTLVVPIALGLLGLIVMVTTGIFYMSWPLLIGVICIGGVVMWLVSKG